MPHLAISPQQQEQMKAATPLLWLNDRYQNSEAAPARPSTKLLYRASARLERCAPLLQQLFPELEPSQGLIESPLLSAAALNQQINPLGGQLLLKADHALPIAGSIKARGGIHEVLCFAEKLALEQGLLSSIEDDYAKLAGDEARELFGRYTLAVGSTGNLGLSIGVTGAALGFRTQVHMSADAKEWKKERLRRRGVDVVEHQADYGVAVAAGRRNAQADPHCYFVDDERSPELFFGYATAALRLQQQLQQQGIIVDADHPLFVYLPSGVGGAPGGITFGLKQLFGDHVHCFLAEPVQAPCTLLGLAGEPGSEPLPCYDFGLNVDTDADGLAVGTASAWVCEAIRDLCSGVYTATDRQLYQQLYQLKSLENIEVEPSAAIGCLGPAMLNSESGQQYLQQHQLCGRLDQSTHIAWLTGGSLVPAQEYQRYLAQAKSCLES
ncbi:D-serine ammonia-lyase [Motiliproteus coralliicola]|uniref:Probable D-serine dehydratase n=1 Tax=Motiliproteus coralliicola TaxID=2283196 RepID=A0A369WGK4_9GAMM|nr:D-serine ammonia-lyase [Motiliproteus coralliicola]RDE19824.1 D-serine ammonia-lyase [Motiliproteus coralliicola]